MTKHTPTPWTLGVIRKRSQTARIDALHYDPDLMHQDWEGMIECCGCHDSPHKGIEKAEANARFIVKAVNHHERLVEALRQVQADIPDVIRNEGMGYIEDLLDEIDEL